MKGSILHFLMLASRLPTSTRRSVMFITSHPAAPAAAKRTGGVLSHSDIARSESGLWCRLPPRRFQSGTPDFSVRPARGPCKQIELENDAMTDEKGQCGGNTTRIQEPRRACDGSREVAAISGRASFVKSTRTESGTGAATSP